MVVQKKLDGTTDCRKAKGTAIIHFSGNNKGMMDALTKLKHDCPCVKITVNGEKLPETPKKWDGVL